MGGDLPLLLVCAVPVLTCTWLGIRVGRKVRETDRPDHEHLGTIQSALLGLLALLLGFAFSGSISRFVDRQDALAREANAIETAYGRAALVPTSERIRAALRLYVAQRLELFDNAGTGREPEILRQMTKQYDEAFAATLDGVKQAPVYSALAMAGVEGVGDQLAIRNALDRRHLPTEFVVVMLASSCIAMVVVGYGVGIAKHRSIASAFALAALIATTLFMTFDFDRPKRGFITLDRTPLEQTAAKLGADTGVKR